MWMNREIILSMSWKTRLFFHITIAPASGPLLQNVKETRINIQRICSSLRSILGSERSLPEAKDKLEEIRIAIMPIHVEEKQDLAVIAKRES